MSFYQIVCLSVCLAAPCVPAREAPLGYSDHRPDLALLLDGELTVFDLKVFDPIGSTSESAGERGGHVGFGNTAERANDVVLGRRGRGAAGFFNWRTGAGYVSPKAGDYARV